MAYPTTRPVTILIATVDRTASVPIESLTAMDAIGQQLDECSFIVEDGAAFSLAIGQEVIIHKPGVIDTRYFGGVIAHMRSWAVGPERHYNITCDDFAWHMDNPEDLVSGFYNSMSDAAIIDDFMDGACSQIDDTTHVDIVTADTVRVEFLNKTPRECVQYLTNISGAMWYVDYGTVADGPMLHYFVTGANDAPYDLSDSPNLSTTFGFKDMELVEEAPKANRVIVIGRNAAATATRTTGAEGDYGHWLTKVLRDDNIFTAAQAVTVGDAFLAAAAEADTVTCTVREPGLRSGMTIEATNAVLGFSSTTFEIQTVRKEFLKGGTVKYYLTLGKYLASFEEQVINSPNVRDTEQYVTKKSGELVTESNDDGVRGAQHILSTYNETAVYSSAIILQKSHDADVGVLTETIDTELLGIILFRGVDSGSNRDFGAWIAAAQSGAAGAAVPTVLSLYAYDASGTIPAARFELDGPGEKAYLNRQLHIEQDDAVAAVPVLVLDQADVDEPFIGFIGAGAVGDCSRSIIDEGDQDVETLEGWLMIEVEDVGNQIADQKYAIPFYSVYSIEAGAAGLAGAGALTGAGMVGVQGAGAIAGAGALSAAGEVIVP